MKTIVFFLLAALPCVALRGEWVDEATKKFPKEEASLIRRSHDTLTGNVTLSDAWSPFRGIMPSIERYKGVWNWDSAFHAMAVSQWDPKLAREQFEILFGKQLPSGALPDVVYADGRMVTSITKPPVMAWAVAVVDHRSPDASFLQGIYPKLVKLGDFWMKERGGEKDGLFYYAGRDAGTDSGWDNSIRWDNGYRKPTDDNHRLWAVDLNCYMVTHYLAMGYIADRLNLPGDKKMWLEKADQLSRRINDKLWDEGLGFYVDRDRVTGENGPALSPAGFMPLFVHIAPAARAARVAKLAADSRKFFPGMPTAAYDTKEFKSDAYWRGPAWLNTSFFALKGLRDYGCIQLADAMRSQLLIWVAQDPSAIREYYDSRTGAGKGAKGFGWSGAFVIAFLLDWNNDNLTWFFPRPTEIFPESIPVVLSPGTGGNPMNPEKPVEKSRP